MWWKRESKALNRKAKQKRGKSTKKKKRKYVTIQYEKHMKEYKNREKSLSNLQFYSRIRGWSYSERMCSFIQRILYERSKGRRQENASNLQILLQPLTIACPTDTDDDDDDDDGLQCHVTFVVYLISHWKKKKEKENNVLCANFIFIHIATLPFDIIKSKKNRFY